MLYTKSQIAYIKLNQPELSGKAVSFVKFTKLRRMIILGAVCVGISSFSIHPYATSYDDKEVILKGVDSLENKQSIQIANPSKSTTSTTDANYYITGTSNPNVPLLCNGEEVADRGIYGTFGVYASLEQGNNVFKFDNGGESISIEIERKESSSQTAITKVTKLSRCTPTTDDVGYPGEEYLLRCTAPAGAKVSATIGEQTYELKQESIAEMGVEAYYSTIVKLPLQEDGVVASIGSIKYSLNYEDNDSEAESSGKVYIVGDGATPLARVSQNAATIYDGYETNSYGTLISNSVSTIAKGAVDKIVGVHGNMFQIGMGNWIMKDYVEIVEESIPYENKVKSSFYGIEGTGEILSLRGKVPSPYKAYDNSKKIVIKFYNIIGLDSINMKSELFSDVLVTPDTENKSVTLEFIKESPNSIIGYSVSYDDEGIHIYFNPTPNVSTGEKPLKGMMVVIDAGHGGYDPGAMGLLSSLGPNEKDITLATAQATKNRLQSLGASVIMTVDENLASDKKLELTDRNQIAFDRKADVFLSIHCNSIAQTANGNKASGTEIYYNENNSKLLADTMLSKITEATNRKTRSVKHGMYYVTRNPLCASMLIEIGFMTNPMEYDDMRNPESIFNTANAIGEALVEYYG